MENTIISERDVQIGEIVRADQLNSGSLREALGHAKISEVKLIGVGAARRLWEAVGADAASREMILTGVGGWWRSGNAEFDEALRESGLQDRVRTRISFEADIADSHWIHPKKPLEFKANCPDCGKPATTDVDEDEYPGEARTLYFECQDGHAFEFTYRYAKVVYVIELPAAVTASGDYQPAEL